VAVNAHLHRSLITFGLILSAFMSAIDTTVANIALPHIQGNISASPEQITWILTAYFIAQAVTIPVSGWLAAQFGLKPMLLTCVFGFTVTSVLCGLATNLPELVLFRALQGMVAAPLMPVAQAVIININPPERLGRATAVFTMAAVVAPAIGPIIGGYLTEDLSWRWCFYINVPTGILSMVLISAFLPPSPPAPRRFDFLGFCSLGVAIASFQLMLDRGTTLDWFSSREICIEAALAGTAFWIFVTHSLTTRHPLFPGALLRDRNYVTSATLGFMFSFMTFSSFALLPLLMQGVLDYPVIYSGVISMPRGIVMFVLLQFMGRIDNLVDRRILIAVGLAFFVLAFWQMSKFDLSMPGRSIVQATILQGIGQGILFVPLSALGFQTIGRHLRPDAAAATNLVRNFGGSIGVALMQVLITRNSSAMHASLAAHIGRELSDAQALPAAIAPDTAQGAVALNAEITRQAVMVAYNDDFRMLMLVGLLCIPLVLLIRPRKQQADAEPAPVEAHG
jgi:DHA2 family multidrug resistance protein